MALLGMPWALASEVPRGGSMTYPELFWLVVAFVLSYVIDHFIVKHW